jgi:hypothetical protein
MEGFSLPRTEPKTPPGAIPAGFCFGHRADQAVLPILSGTKTALCRLPGIAPRSKESPMVSGAYLRQQAEILIAMSRATLDLGMARRLREMASELQARAAEQEDTRAAAEQEDKRGSNDNELGNVRPPFRIGT